MTRPKGLHQLPGLFGELHLAGSYGGIEPGADDNYRRAGGEHH